MQGNLSGIDIGILFLYGAVFIGMGIYYTRKCRTAEQFMVAGRSIPAWAAPVRSPALRAGVAIPGTTRTARGTASASAGRVERTGQRAAPT